MLGVVISRAVELLPMKITGIHAAKSKRSTYWKRKCVRLRKGLLKIKGLQNKKNIIG